MQLQEYEWQCQQWYADPNPVRKVQLKEHMCSMPYTAHELRLLLGDEHTEAHVDRACSQCTAVVVVLSAAQLAADVVEQAHSSHRGLCHLSEHKDYRCTQWHRRVGLGMSLEWTVLKAPPEGLIWWLQRALPHTWEAHS